MAIRIQLRRDTAANWTSSNPVLRAGELGIETDTLKFKIGNGSSTWTQITAYANVTTTGLENSLNDYILAADQGNAGGPAELDSNGDLLVPENSIILWDDAGYTYTTTVTATQPTANRTITLPNATGTVALTSDLPSQYTDELAQDAAAAALAAGTHTNITVTYNDNANSISLAAAPGYVDEQAVDAVAAALAAGTHTNITVGYNDVGNAISLTGAVTYTDENAQDAVGNAVGTGLSYNDTTGAISVDTSAIQARVTNVTDTEIGYLDGVTSAIQTQLDAKAPIASPTFTGTVTLPAAPTLDLHAATKKYVDDTVSGVIDGAPDLLNTLNELAAAINDDANYTTTLTTALGNKQDKVTNVSDTEIGYLDGVTSSIQTQINAKAASADIAELAQDAVGTILSSDLAYNDSTPGIALNYVTVGNTLLDGVSGSSYGLIGTSTYLDVKNTNGYNKEIELDIAAVKTQLNTDGYITTSSTSTLTNKTLTSPKINEDVAVTATATELNYVDGVTSAIQTQLDGKVDESIITAKGDLYIGSASATLDNLAVGTNGYLLTADSNETLGVKWAAAPISLPSQTGESGKYLTTNGTSASWGTLVVPITTGTSTVSANTATTVDTTALSAFTSIEYMVSLKQGSKIRTSKVVVQTDGTSVDMTEFAITETGGTIPGVVISATTASTDAVLQLTATDAATTNVTVKFSKVAL